MKFGHDDILCDKKKFLSHGRKWASRWFESYETIKIEKKKIFFNQIKIIQYNRSEFVVQL